MDLQAHSKTDVADHEEIDEACLEMMKQMRLLFQSMTAKLEEHNSGSEELLKKGEEPFITAERIMTKEINDMKKHLPEILAPFEVLHKALEEDENTENADPQEDPELVKAHQEAVDKKVQLIQKLQDHRERAIRLKEYHANELKKLQEENAALVMENAQLENLRKYARCVLGVVATVDGNELKIQFDKLSSSGQDAVVIINTETFKVRSNPRLPADITIGHLDEFLPFIIKARNHFRPKLSDC